ncbi:hypothetical protein ACI8AC_24110 [Geodermatophilus sp. SYSU D00758]
MTPPAGSTPRPAGTPTSASPESWTPGQTTRERVIERIARMHEAGALDAGNGDVLDAWLEGVRSKRHAYIAAERTRRVVAAEQDVRRLEAEAVVAEQRAQAAADELAHTERLVTVLEGDLLGPAENHAGDRRERRRRPRPRIDPLEGMVRSRTHRGVILGLLLLAAAGDFATFRLTLAGFFTDGGDFVIWTLTAALTAASVGLMHVVGRSFRELREGRGGLGRVAIGLMFAGWATLGGVAVWFRWQQPIATTTSTSFGGGATTTHDPRAAAVLLGGLFLASGLLAFYAGYSDHHPRMATYLGLRQPLPQQRDVAASAAQKVAELGQALAHARGEQARADTWAAEAGGIADAEIDELKELARVELAGHLGAPDATNGLTTGRTRPTERRGPDDLPNAKSAGPDPAAEPDTSRAIPVPEASFPLPFPSPSDAASNGNGSLNGTH